MTRFVFILFFIGITNSCFASNFCRLLFTDKEGFSLTSQLSNLRRVNDPQVFKSNSIGNWISIGNKEFHYFFQGKGQGPIRVHLEGLGGSIEQGLVENRVLAEHVSHGGRVLIVEFKGQGRTEVLRRYRQSVDPYLSPQIIDYSQNVKDLLEVLKKISQKHSFSFKEVIWNGHSFGGMMMAGVMAKGKFQSRVLQFLASGVTHFNHFLLTERENQLLSGIVEWWNNANPLLRLGDRAAMESAKGSLSGSLPYLLQDPVKLVAAAGLTVGSQSVNVKNELIHLNHRKNIQVFTGEKDMFVFAMLHYELVLDAQRGGHKTLAVIVEGADHYITRTMTKEQAEVVRKLSNEPPEESGFYFLKENGQMLELNQQEALNHYKELSWETWQKLKTGLLWTFATAGVTAEYPSSWKP